jgi:hypothetical protein
MGVIVSTLQWFAVEMLHGCLETPSLPIAPVTNDLKPPPGHGVQPIGTQLIGTAPCPTTTSNFRQLSASAINATVWSYYLTIRQAMVRL